MGQYVLIVDDDPDVVMMVNDILENMGLETRQANDGRTGLDIARQEPPAALVLDLMMPVMDGSLVLEELQNDQTLSAVPVIVLSAYIDEHEDSYSDHPNVIGVISKGRSHHEELRRLLTEALS